MTFLGVRGSTPCHGPSTARYGGNTSCVAVTAPGSPPIFLDLGTGLRYYGRPECGTPFRAAALVTHMHFDHVQGLPFFPPMLESGNELDVYGPAQDDGRTLKQAFDSIVCPPQFPVTLDLFSGTFRFHDIGDCDFMIGEVKVTARHVPHIGPTLGYRLEHGGRVVTYVSDHQQPYDGAHTVPESVRELADGAHILIHDAQYTGPEFEKKYYFGHCTQDYAVAVARECGVRTLALYHHDPERTDDQLDSACREEPGLRVIPAREGLVLSA